MADDGPAMTRPVTAELKAAPGSVRAGGTVELVLKIEVAAPAHIYAPSEPADRSVPTTIKLDLPKGVTLEKDWVFPAPVKTSDGDLIYTGSVEARCTLKISSAVSAPTLVIKGDLRCQACTDLACWPPLPIPLSTTIALETVAP